MSGFDDLLVARRVWEDLGPLLREQRERLNVTREEVSAVTGITARHLATIEAGKANPMFASFMKILDWMVSSYGDPPRPGESREEHRVRSARAFQGRTDR